MESRRAGVLWIALGAALWGTDTVFRRPLSGALDPARIVLYEHLLLALAVLPVVMRDRVYLGKIPLKAWINLLAISWVGSAFSTVLFTAAIRSGNPTTAVLLQKTQPVFAILFARWLTQEKWPRFFPVIATAAIGGGYLVAFGSGSLLQPFASIDAWPAFLATCAAIGWALSTVWGRMVSTELPFEMITALRVLCALPLLFAITAIQHQTALPPSSAFPSLLWMALIPGFAGLMFYYRGLKNTAATSATIAELSFPLTASLLNWLILGIHVSLVQLIGFGIVWCAILSLTTLAANQR
jgi:drug/metabolite transporter (DMT)-like permease